MHQSVALFFDIGKSEKRVSYGKYRLPAVALPSRKYPDDRAGDELRTDETKRVPAAPVQLVAARSGHFICRFAPVAGPDSPQPLRITFSPG